MDLLKLEDLLPKFFNATSKLKSRLDVDMD